MKVISKMDFVHDGDRFKRGTTHEVEATTEILKFIEIGYLVEVLEVKELKVEKKTKEFKIEKETK
jgi:hypothetical protein